MRDVVIQFFRFGKLSCLVHTESNLITMVIIPDGAAITFRRSEGTGRSIIRPDCEVNHYNIELHRPILNVDFLSNWRCSMARKTIQPKPLGRYENCRGVE